MSNDDFEEQMDIEGELARQDAEQDNVQALYREMKADGFTRDEILAHIMKEYRIARPERYLEDED